MNEDYSEDDQKNFLEMLKKEEEIVWCNVNNTTTLDSLTCKVEIW